MSLLPLLTAALLLLSPSLSLPSADLPLAISELLDFPSCDLDQSEPSLSFTFAANCVSRSGRLRSWGKFLPATPASSTLASTRFLKTHTRAAADTKYTCAIDADFNLHCWGAHPAGLPAGIKALRVDGGSSHLCALTFTPGHLDPSDLSLTVPPETFLRGLAPRCWGPDKHAAKVVDGDWSPEDPVVDIGTSLTATCIRTLSGKASCFGSFFNPIMGHRAVRNAAWAGAKARAMVVAQESVCMVMEDGRVECEGEICGEVPAACGGMVLPSGLAAGGNVMAVGHSSLCWLNSEQEAECVGELEYFEAKRVFKELYGSNDVYCGVLTNDQVKCFGNGDPDSAPLSSDSSIYLQ